MKKLLTILLMICSGCGTVTHGPTQEIIVTSDPMGATVTPTDYKCWVKTPGILELDRNHGTVLTARLEGYEDCKVELKWGVSPWAFFNMIALQYPESEAGCQLLGVTWAADADSIGNLSPNEVHFELVPKKKTILPR